MTRPGLLPLNVVVYLQSSFHQQLSGRKHVNVVKHKLAKCVTHVQSCSSAETLRAVIVNMVSGVANLKKSVMPLAID